MKPDGTHLKSTIPQTNFFRGQNLLELYLQGLVSDRIIYAGGSVFHSNLNGFFNKDNAFLKLHKLKGIKLGAIGVSLGPYKSSDAREDIKEYLKHFEFISLRDKRSYFDALSMNLSIPVIESFDLAALLPLMYSFPNKRQENIEIGISFSDYQKHIKEGEASLDQRRFEGIVETVKTLSAHIKKLTINILIINNHNVVGDRERSLELKRHLENFVDTKITEYSSKASKMCKAISDCSFVLATRLHAGMLSCFYETPFMQIEYHQKCSDFLDYIGYREDYRIGDYEKNPEEVANLILEIIEFDKEEELFSKDIKVLQKKAKNNFIGTKEYI